MDKWRLLYRKKLVLNYLFLNQENKLTVIQKEGGWGLGEKNVNFGPLCGLFKNWFSGSVSNCSLEVLQLCVRSCDRKGMTVGCIPTTQVAVVCLAKIKNLL